MRMTAGVAPNLRVRSAARRLRVGDRHPLKHLVGTLAFAVFVVAIWHVWTTWKDVDRIIAARPADVWQEIATHPRMYLGATATTLILAAVGLVLGTTVGVVLALAGWWSPVLNGLVSPMALIFRSVPIVATIPILASTMGYSTETVVVVVAVVTFFPALAWASSGLRSPTESLSNVFTSLGSNRITRLSQLHVPASLPHVMVGLRTTAPLSIMATIVSEYVMNEGGLGRQFALSRLDFRDSARSWGAAALSVILAYLAYSAANQLGAYISEHFTD